MGYAVLSAHAGELNSLIDANYFRLKARSKSSKSVLSHVKNSLAAGRSTSEGYSEIAKRREILARRTARGEPIFWSAHMWRFINIL